MSQTGGMVYEDKFAYDAVGNRVTRIKTVRTPESRGWPSPERSGWAGRRRRKKPIT
ncbi:MAG: hypothetical protein V1899_01740 [Planctomycetota bacterium]